MPVLILIDMNLSPDWCDTLREAGWEARHWSEIGSPRAPDTEIMAWARANNALVLTHDLDFGTILAATNAGGPSVIQIRAQDVLPSTLGPTVISALRQFADSLMQGALVTVEPHRRRARILPFRPSIDSAKESE